MFGIQTLINYFYPAQELPATPTYIVRRPDLNQQLALLESQVKTPSPLNKKEIKIHRLELSKKKLNELIKTADNDFFLEFHKKQLEEVCKKLYALEDKVPKKLPAAQKPTPQLPSLPNSLTPSNRPLKPSQSALQETPSLGQLIHTEFQSLISQNQEITVVESTTKKTWKLNTKFLSKILKTTLQQLSSDLPYYLVTTKGNKWIITLPADDLSEIHICFDKDNPTVIGITASKENQDAIRFFFKKALEASEEEIAPAEETLPAKNEDLPEASAPNDSDASQSQSSPLHQKSHPTWTLQTILRITVVAVVILAIFVAAPLIIHAVYGFSAVVILGISLPYLWLPIIGGAIPVAGGGLGFLGYKASLWGQA